MEAKVFAGPTVAAGCVRHHPGDPAFRTPAVVRGFRFVFPRLAVWIRTNHAHRYVSNSSVVEYYNDGDEYAREPLDPRGDSTEWYEVAEGVIREIVARYDRAAADARRPYRHSHGATDGGAYASQRLLFRRLSSGRCDPLEVEETILSLLDASLASTYGVRRRAASPIRRHEREIAERTKAVLSAMGHRAAPLAAISRETGVSMFHLCRVFRRVTGHTLASYHLRLRIMASLDALLESDAPIGDIAVQHGFRSQSHFGYVFRRVVGVPPSSVRSRRPE